MVARDVLCSVDRPDERPRRRSPELACSRRRWRTLPSIKVESSMISPRVAAFRFTPASVAAVPREAQVPCSGAQAGPHPPAPDAFAARRRPSPRPGGPNTRRGDQAREVPGPTSRTAELLKEVLRPRPLDAVDSRAGAGSNCCRYHAILTLRYRAMSDQQEDRQSQRQAFDFLRECFRGNRPFTKTDLAQQVGWTAKSISTYWSKQFEPFLKPVAPILRGAQKKHQVFG